jgi:hypothetical protein
VDDPFEPALRSLLHDAAERLPVEDPEQVLADIRQRRRRRARRRRHAAVATVGVLVAGTIAAVAAIHDDHPTTLRTTTTSTAAEVRASLDGPTVDELAAGTWRRAAAPPRAISYPVVTAWTGDEVLVLDGGGAAGLAYAPVPDTWRETAPMPGPPRSSPVGVWTGDRLLVLGGLDAAGRPADRALFAYDPDADAWTTLAAPPLDVSAAVWADDRLVATDAAADRVARYDPRGDTWESLPAPRASGLHLPSSATLAWDGTVTLWRWGVVSDPTAVTGRLPDAVVRGDRLVGDHWEALADGVGVHPEQPVATPVGVLAIGGSVCPPPASCPPVLNGQALRLEGSTWVASTSSEVMLSEHASVWADRVLVIGGAGVSTSDGSDPPVLEPVVGAVWDPVTDEWRQLPTPLAATGLAFTWTGTELVALGADGAQLLDPGGREHA